VASLGEAHFRWAVERMGALMVRLAREPGSVPPRRWDALLPASRRA